MCRSFHRDEVRYEQWLAANQNVWVFDNFGGDGAHNNQLHHLPCGHINTPTDHGHWTRNEKFCCTDRECIGRTIAHLRGGEDTWENCECVNRNG
jgi:hypothetical protein